MNGLLREIKKYYKKEERVHLPWRKTKDPYKILVSEIMLQQTQVKRVLPFYAEFTKHFPTAKKLARASLSNVLKQWQGLGYNRRAKFLHQAAKLITDKYKGRFPTEVPEIEQLPGVGHYTARAVAVFAFNQPEVCIETNIRTVFLHHFFNVGHPMSNIGDKEILPLVAEALKKSRMQPRDFYAALMDYGAHLKGQGIKLNSRSKHYTKQSTFEGSARQLRGQIIKLLLQKPQTESGLIYQSTRKSKEVRKVLIQLKKEKLISYKNKKFSIAK